MANGWNKETIGHHIVRNNTISHCEQTGVVGSLGPIFSVITGNTIHDIHVRRAFTGAEMAGIKLHGAIDVEISENHIYRTCRGLWLDWMAQGTRVTRNLFHENASEDLFVEVDHGPFLVDNNFFLSPVSLLDMSEGGAFVHNLFAGRIISRPELSRDTPFHKAHSTELAGITNIKGGDNRFYNNIFIGDGQPPAAMATGKDYKAVNGYGLWVYNTREYPLFAAGNVYVRGARPHATEEDPVVLDDVDPQLKLVEEGGAFFVQAELEPGLDGVATQRVTSEVLGKARIPGLGYENPDGSPLAVDRDFFGQPRDAARPTAGPLERPGTGALKIKLR
jgi:hypothetical protein